MIEYLKVARIDHWLKNIFIVFGHAVAVVLVLDMEITGDVVKIAVLSLIPACLVASANYILNEILDAPFDKLHPTKKLRPIPAGLVKLPILWAMFVGCLIVGFALAFWWFKNPGYHIALALLAISGLVYNIQPVRLKDRAFLDVIAESFNNPIRLWLGWYAVLETTAQPPASIVLAWWAFGGLLMTGKRYSEYRFINNKELSGQYRKSFQVYSNTSLIIAMITYANFFCFCAGYAISNYESLNNLALVFPVIIFAIIAYFNQAMSEVGARLEPEQLMQKPLIIICTLLSGAITVGLLWAHKMDKFHFKAWMDSPTQFGG
ncbi:UbiA family prenyltransferase [Verrucomicrobiales bacterium]|jgi:4-hydroxybenzoate polyprenyltransferase|nr:UbiA family prenyltransferase [Verrucomicrobiales bacterium]MDC0322366.1 UbiA family prenyltransferase [Verrucomicrobiales bacterium]